MKFESMAAYRSFAITAATELLAHKKSLAEAYCVQIQAARSDAEISRIMSAVRKSI